MFTFFSVTEQKKNCFCLAFSFSHCSYLISHVYRLDIFTKTEVINEKKVNPFVLYMSVLFVWMPP